MRPETAKKGKKGHPAEKSAAAAAAAAARIFGDDWDKGAGFKELPLKFFFA